MIIPYRNSKLEIEATVNRPHHGMHCCSHEGVPVKTILSRRIHIKK